MFVKRTAVVMAHMAPQQGMNWREYMGAIICLIGYKVVFIYWNERCTTIMTNWKDYMGAVISLVSKSERINQRTGKSI